MTLILPQVTGSYDRATLVDAVNRYLTLMRANGVADSALPPVLLGVDDLNFWITKVLDGGHIEYVTSKGSTLLPSLHDALFTAQACGIQPWADILKNVSIDLRSLSNSKVQSNSLMTHYLKQSREYDRTFAATWAKDEAAFVAAVLALPGVRQLPQDTFEAAVREEARHHRPDSPIYRNKIARAVAKTCRAWFADAGKVALSLACGKAGFPSHVFMADIPIDDGPDSYSIIKIPQGLASGITAIALRSADGLRLQTGLPKDTGTVLAEVNWAEVSRAQTMALAFRLPESIGLRWARTGRAFSLEEAELRVMPGFTWLPTKWRIALACQDWAVKGSPKRTTFIDGPGKWQETLSQTELSALLADSGLMEVSPR